jgi:protein tyrosine phosphatase (PTP) superfamily phosphohydrolase (DUF442 family)
MFNLEWLRARGVSRGEPGSHARPGRRLAVLGLLFASSLLQMGCQSGPSGCNSGLFGPCGFVARTTNRLMRPFRHGEAACAPDCASDGGCVSSGVPVEGAAGVVTYPGAVVTPGAMPSNQLSAPAEAPSNLEPLPRGDIGPPPGTSRRTPPATGTKTNSSYETQRPDYRSTRSRGENLAHTLTSAPVPAARSAQGPSASRASGRDAADADAEGTLDHLPPLDLPAEVTEKSSTPPVPPAAERKPQTTTTPAPASASATASDQPGGRPAVPDKLSLAGSVPSAPEPVQPAGGAPGIARFAAVDLKLAGGSLPSVAGLDWLEEKGYRTLVDLREPSETDAAFIAEAARRNFRYIALPISLKTIDREHLARFNFELALSEARPLYFFDRDGARAGTLWYLRRVTLDRINTQIARREAEELGLSEPAYWAAAANFLSQPEVPRGQASAADDAARLAVPASGRQDSAMLPILELPRTAATDRSATTFSTQAHDEPETPGPPALSQRPALPAAADPSGWNSFATLLMTGLTFPLACWGRAAVPTTLERTRASLPAPARPGKSLRPASDA